MVNSFWPANIQSMGKFAVDVVLVFTLYLLQYK